MTATMHLAFDLSWTHLQGRWRLPGSWTGVNYPDIAIFKEIASIAERGRIDMLFFGDGTGIPSTWRGSPEEAVRWGIGWPRQDMSPTIAVLSQVTKHLGFGITYSSTFMHPFYVARLMNSLDHMTGGRIAFNVVASTRPADAANYGFDKLMEHDQRYERMEEFVDVCKALWASVEPDAFIWDRESGIVVAEPEKVQPINHEGRFFKVKGPLSCVPSPQTRPVLIPARDQGFGTVRRCDLRRRETSRVDGEASARPRCGAGGGRAGAWQRGDFVGCAGGGGGNRGGGEAAAGAAADGDSDGGGWRVYFA
jgi:hypothetical protein